MAPIDADAQELDKIFLRQMSLDNQFKRKTKECSL